MSSFQRRMRPLLGTYIELGLNSQCDPRVFDSAFRAIEEVQLHLSFHDPASDLSRLNRSFGSEIELHPISAKVLRLARAMTKMTNGLFNCTVGAQLQNLGLLPKHQDRAYSFSGRAEDIRICGHRAQLLKPFQITLDGIAKGYAVDIALKQMKAHGAQSGWVNAGGDLKVFGEVKLPLKRRESDGTFSTFGELTNGAIATSLVQFPTKRDLRFPGAIVAQDKRQPTAGVWSVLAPSAWLADALTKVASLAPDGEKSSLVQSFGGRLLNGLVKER